MGKPAVAGGPLVVSTGGGPSGRNSSDHCETDRRVFPFFRPAAAFGRPSNARAGHRRRPNFLAAKHFGKRCGLTSVEIGEKRLPLTRDGMDRLTERFLEQCPNEATQSGILRQSARQSWNADCFRVTHSGPMFFLQGTF